MNDQATRLKELVAKNGERNSKFITIASGKGGVGKTNFALNFSYVMANEFKKKILLIDADIGMANIQLLLNVDPNKNMKNLLHGEAIEDVLQHSHGFDVLLGFSGIDDMQDLEEVTIQSLIFDLGRISKGYDYVVIDTGAGVSDSVVSFLRASHKAYFITTPEPTALMDAYALMRSVYNLYGYKEFKVVVNMAKSKEEGQETFDRLKMTVQKFLDIDIQLLGILPYTNNLKNSVRSKEIVALRYPKDSYTTNIRAICQDESHAEPVKSESFWQKLFEFIGSGSKRI